MRTPQTIAERHQALESLLPLLHVHHAYLDQVRSSLGGLSPSAPEGPPVVQGEDADEPWVLQERLLARAYRLDEVARLLALLEEHRPRWALAVYYEHVEPWPAWEPKERAFLGAFVEIMDMAEAFAEGPSKSKAGKISEEQKIKRQLASFLSALAAGDTMDLTTAPLESSFRSVITLEKRFLNDSSMSDLVDGTFRVVGKVTRVIDEHEGAISLNRKTALSRLPNAIMAQLMGALQGPELSEFALPAMEWEIPGPVIQVLPIAIFA